MGTTPNFGVVPTDENRLRVLSLVYQVATRVTNMCEGSDGRLAVPEIPLVLLTRHFTLAAFTLSSRSFAA